MFVVEDQIGDLVAQKEEDGILEGQEHLEEREEEREEDNEGLEELI